MKNRKNTKRNVLAGILLAASMLTTMPCMTTLAEIAATADTTTATQTTVPTNRELAEQRKSQPVASNEIKGWPQGPAIGAEGACLMDIDTGAILYNKNMDERLYPASVTKIMTCLIAMEECEMNEKVSFSAEAINAVPWDGCNMGMRPGEKLTMEQCLNGILVHSANEVANAVGEHISGSMEEFADLMNQRAKELGCKNTHFVNSNGLFDENHYTSAHDLALMGQQFFQFEELCEMSSKHSFTVKKTNQRPEGFTVASKNKFFNGEFTYDRILGSKTGYTDESRQTLVTGAEKDGRRLVCVILKEESPAQFEDTIQLFDYGFQNFKNVSIKEKGGYEELVEAAASNPEAELSYELDDEDACYTIPVNLKRKNIKSKFTLRKSSKEKTENVDGSDLAAEASEDGVYEQVESLDGVVTYRYQGVLLGRANVYGESVVTVEPEVAQEVEPQQEEAPSRKKTLVFAAAALGMLALLIGCVVYWNKKKRS